MLQRSLQAVDIKHYCARGMIARANAHISAASTRVYSISQSYGNTIVVRSEVLIVLVLIQSQSDPAISKPSKWESCLWTELIKNKYGRIRGEGSCKGPKMERNKEWYQVSLKRCKSGLFNYYITLSGEGVDQLCQSVTKEAVGRALRNA